MMHALVHMACVGEQRTCAIKVEERRRKEWRIAAPEAEQARGAGCTLHAQREQHDAEWRQDHGGRRVRRGGEV